MRSRPGSGRLRLVLALAAIALFAAYGGSASALSLDNSTDTSLTLDNDVNWFHGAWQPYTFGNYQFVAYWDDPGSGGGNVYLVVVRRRLSDNDRDYLIFDGVNSEEAYPLEAPRDIHNGVGIGVSPNDGRVHLSWSLHTTDRRHRYVVSAAGCFDQATFNDANCDFRRKRVGGVDAYYHADRDREARLTYPLYFNDNLGRLYFSYRYDASARGDTILNVYDDAGGWTARGRVVRGTNPSNDRNLYFRYDPDGAGPLGVVETRERGVYVDEYKFDKNDRLHLSFVFRENGTAGQHGVYYVYSDDYGLTWNNSDGRRVATTSSDPITILDRPDVVVAEEPPGFRVEAYSLEIDSNNQPHLFKAASDVQTADDLAVNARQKHYWRTANGDWHVQWVESAGEGSTTWTAGDIMFDEADNIYAIYGRNEVGWAPRMRDFWRQDSLPMENFTWQGGEFLDIQLYSTTTCIGTTANVATAISTTGTDTIRVRMRNDTTGTDPTFYWTTDASQTWASGREQTFVRGMRAGGYTDYSFRITDADWRNNLRWLEMCWPETISTGSISIDSIALYNSTTRATVKSWDFRAGQKLMVAEASSNNNWATWARGDLFSETVSDVQVDSLWRMDNVRYARDKKVNFVMTVQGAPGTEELSLREFDILGDTVIKYWPFDYDQIGWTAPAGVSSFAWANDGGTKGLSGRISSSDPQLLSMSNLKVPIASNRYVHVKLKNSSDARRAALYFITDADRTWNTTKRVQFPITARSGYTTYNVDMSGAAGWSNQTLYQLRLDPADDGTSSGSFNVDRIWIDNTP